MVAPPPEGGTTIRLAKHHFPFWLSARRLGISRIDIALEPQSGAHISAGDLQGVVTATLNGSSASEWDESADLSLLVNSHFINDAELDGDNLEISLALEGANVVPIADLLLRLHYSATA